MRQRPLPTSFQWLRRRSPLGLRTKSGRPSALTPNQFCRLVAWDASRAKCRSDGGRIQGAVGPSSLPMLLRQQSDAIDAHAMSDVDHVGDVFELQFFCAIDEEDPV